MQPSLVLGVFLGYAILLVVIGRLTATRDNSGFFLAGRSTPWYVVAFGMIGASLSGVTFISVPGQVAGSGFSYLQMVFGFMLGYVFIMAVLMPLYYRLKLTSIYGYLGQRFGPNAYRTGAVFFLISRVIGASFRLFLVALVLQMFVLQPMGWDVHLHWLGVEWPLGLAATTLAVLGVIYSYTRNGGLKTVVWTDTLQTAAMLVAVVLAIDAVAHSLGNGSWLDLWEAAEAKGWTGIWIVDDWKAPNHAVKQILAGALIAATMTGMDQDMMQKNLACKNLRDARLNMGSFAVVLVVINGLFLFLGAVLWLQAEASEFVPVRTDALFPGIALDGGLGWGVALMFLIGLMAAAFSSADSALTALTTSVCVDLLATESRNEADALRIRKRVHIGMTLLLATVMLGFSMATDTSVLNSIFTAANYTYGPLLGLFLFGITCERGVRDQWIPWLAIASPFLCYGLESWLSTAFEFSFGFALLAVNGGLMYVGLWILSKSATSARSAS
jgi:SSS family solute:Na+ symporter